MSKIIYRPLQKRDAPAAELLINESFGLYLYVTDKKTLSHMTHAYLQSCLAEQTYCQVAEKDDQVVGVIMGKADKYYRISTHLFPMCAVLWQSMCMNVQAHRSGANTADYKIMHKIYHELLTGRKNNYDGVLTLFAVDSACRGYGVGKELLHRLEQYLYNCQVRCVYLYTDSTCNIGFYDHLGFSCVDKRDMTVTRSGEADSLQVFLYEKTYI